MVSSSKILTVSYGTFSCTAEGFEDPLAAVKDATRFYQGVVREDRFFGSEPPRLDAEMAEQMMSQHFGATMSEDRLLLQPLSGFGAASTGALSAALAAGPRRASAAPVAPVEAEADAEAPVKREEAAEADAATEETHLTEKTDSRADVQAPDEAPEAEPVTADARPEAQAEDSLEAAAPAALPDDRAAAIADEEAEVAQDTDAAAEKTFDAGAMLADSEDTTPGADAEAFSGTSETTVESVMHSVPTAEEDTGISEPQDDDATSGHDETSETEDTLDLSALFGPADEEDSAAAPELSGEPAGTVLAEDAYEDAYEDDEEAFVATGFDTDTMGTLDDDMAQDKFIAEPAAAMSEPADTPPAPASAGSRESVAAKLKRIRDVVARIRPQTESAEATAQDDLYSEDEHAYEAEPDAFDAPDMTGILGAVAQAGDAGDENIARTGTSGPVSHDTLSEDAPESRWFDTDATDTDPFVPLEDNSAPMQATSEDDAEDDTVAAAVPEATSEAPAARVGQDQAPQRRPRVVKVKRADFDAAVAAGRLQPMAEAKDVSGTMPDDLPAMSSLSPEEEEELARELAAVEAELDLEDWDDEDDDWPEVEGANLSRSGGSVPLRLENALPAEPEEDADTPASRLDEDDEEVYAAERNPRSGIAEMESEPQPEPAGTVAQEGARKAVKMSSPGRAMLVENRIEEDDSSVERILDETNTQLEEPEGSRRRNAIAHLRAAVAATRADRLLGRQKDADEEFEPYREDLASVVRPRRPQTSPVARSERPRTDVRPAPLKLVAEQRVDTADMSPVRPRRIRREDLDEDIDMNDDGGFAAYAADMGATELPDLLEAAASYMAFVEGREQFSRPQLMTRVRQVEAMDYSREDRLRSFGQLLREGKIEKTRSGRFTASDSISFKPKARAAG